LPGCILPGILAIVRITEFVRVDEIYASQFGTIH
jgi:hypothetical protein